MKLRLFLGLVACSVCTCLFGLAACTLPYVDNTPLVNVPAVRPSVPPDSAAAPATPTPSAPAVFLVP